MFLTKQALESVRFVSTDDPRYSLNGILVRPDGSTVATDGHKLIVYTPAGQPEADDFPVVDGCNPASEGELEPFIMGKDAVKQIAKALPKKSSLPILQLAAVDVDQTNKNGHAVVAVTDLENPQVFRPQKLEGSFPRYENVIPKSETELCHVGLGVGQLLQIAQTLKAQGFKGVRLSLQKPTMTETEGATVDQEVQIETGDKPVTFDGKNEYGEVKIVLMPYDV